MPFQTAPIPASDSYIGYICLAAYRSLLMGKPREKSWVFGKVNPKPVQQQPPFLFFKICTLDDCPLHYLQNSKHLRECYGIAEPKGEAKSLK